MSVHRIEIEKGKIRRISQRGTGMWRWTSLKALSWGKPASSGGGVRGECQGRQRGKAACRRQQREVNNCVV